MGKPWGGGGTLFSPAEAWKAVAVSEAARAVSNDQCVSSTQGMAESLSLMTQVMQAKASKGGFPHSVMLRILDVCRGCTVLTPFACDDQDIVVFFGNRESLHHCPKDEGYTNMNRFDKLSKVSWMPSKMDRKHRILAYAYGGFFAFLV
jgi:hypothetical protein